MPSGGIFDTPAKEARLIELTRLLEAPDFWNNQSKANTVLKEKSDIERSLKDMGQFADRISDLEAMSELASEDGGEGMQDELSRGIVTIESDISKAEIAVLLSGEHDRVNAIVSIHPGAGGVEAQDWAEMLMRMYLRWAEKNGFGRDILDYQAGENFLGSGLYCCTIGNPL